jgi:hypothetical protein
MKRAMFSVMTLVVLAGFVGCASERGRHPLLSSCGGGAAASEGCQQASCDANCETGCGDPEQCADPGRKCRLCKERPVQSPPAAGPATGAITYPYYTVRGPRDFLAKNPGSIGP